ncbi:MAG: TadE/TadG family type IV pilus assembly protein [Gemmataceae bacterium]
MRIQRLQSRRRAATALETVVVVIPVVLFMFGVFQYGRLLMDWNVLNNAAREGCRYALVNNTSATVASDVDAVITTRMGGEKKSFTTWSVTVSGTHLGVDTPVNSLVPGDLVTVTVSGKYKFINLPIPTPIMTMTSAVTMVCEGGT